MFLAVESLSVRYRGPASARAAVHEASFGLQVGEIGVLIGPSGCGKTSLLRAIAGLERCADGPRAHGRRAAGRCGGDLHLAPEDRRIGMVFQDYALFPHLTVADNVGFGLHRLRPRGARRAHPGGAGPGWPGPRRAAGAASVVRRPAATHRAGACTGAAAAAAAARRALLQPRRRPARAARTRSARHPEVGGHDGPVRHPRPDGSLRARRLDRRHARRRAGTMGRRLHAVPPAGDALRRTLHRPWRVRAGADRRRHAGPARADRARARSTTPPNARCPTPSPAANATSCCAPTTSCTTTPAR